ncbi:RND transporter MmpL9 [Mycobacterium tuberculosis]|uniref:RND transporter MmpL9 n=1 Tax=Mycobacterium tuberculosis TaxID=1773 RepID=UPI0005E551FF|nr:RND transporter MmpL9 [Mycobacterium tuberculosis]CKR51084.1 transmembrane transporter mmpL9 [Mycobacterium tuberculosis]
MVPGEVHMSDTPSGPHPIIPRTIRLAAIPILLCWLGFTVFVSVAVPPLEAIGETRAVAVAPDDAQSMRAMRRAGKVFNEFDSNSIAMVVLESDQPLGEKAHRYYDHLVDTLVLDQSHIQHIQDFWRDPLTAAGAVSADGKAAYVQLYLAGNMGEALANESVEAVRKIVANSTPPEGIRTYVTGPAALFADQIAAGDRSMKLITGLTFAVITVLLLLVYRSIATTLLILPMVFIGLGATRGTIAFLGYHGMVGLSTFVVNILTALAIAAGTDYAIFLVGRYQEARHIGQNREASFYTMYRGTANVILGSGLTIAGATYCLSFARLTLFHTMGPPLAIGMLVSVAAALTLAPAIIAIAGRFGLLDPKRRLKTRGWRRVGTAVVRWPGPILATSVALALVGLLALPGYRPGYNDRYYLRAGTPVNRGYAAADRHFGPARMNPEMLLVESDQDMRNPAGMLVIDKIAKEVLHVSGVERVQAITRPQGVPLEHASIPFQISMMGATQTMSLPYMRERMADMLTMSDEMLVAINSMEQMLDLVQQLNDVTHEMAATTREIKATTSELRDHLADIDDFVRPLRSYFYWEHHCFDIPLCSATRSLFDTLDGVDTLTDQLRALTDDMNKMEALTPQFLALLPPMITTMKTMRTMMLTMRSTISGVQDQMADMQDHATAMGQAFDTAKSGDSFYLPPEAFDNAEFQQGMKLFLSPNGKAVRFVISHESDPASTEGIDRIEAIRAATKDAIKATPLQGAKIYIGGTAATYQDIRDGTKYDILIVGIAAVCLVFIVMLMITQSLIASLVIVGTVLLSLGTAFGLSVLIWQHFVGLQVHWTIVAMSVIVLLAVGSDYNLLLVSRFKEEVGAGLKTGIIRAMAGTGAVVTSAGLVFAFTMASMAVSELRVIGQVGTTIGLGLLFDTLVVRSFMTPSIAALLGRWFWWPNMIHSRPPVPEAHTRQGARRIQPHLHRG